MNAEPQMFQSALAAQRAASGATTAQRESRKLTEAAERLSIALVMGRHGSAAAACEFLDAYRDRPEADRLAAHMARLLARRDTLLNDTLKRRCRSVIAQLADRGAYLDFRRYWQANGQRLVFERIKARQRDRTLGDVPYPMLGHEPYWSAAADLLVAWMAANPGRARRRILGWRALIPTGHALTADDFRVAAAVAVADRQGQPRRAARRAVLARSR